MQKAKQASYRPFDASKWRVGIVVAQFNRHITDELYETALARAKQYKIPAGRIETRKVAGAAEIPLVLQQMAATGTYQALLAIGCVIKGETPHFDYVCRFVGDGILRVQLDHSQPIGFGVLTCNNESEALARKHLGAEHLDAVMHQAKILKG
jgi:6,7-dimethyl-8-ribityllumazine synthase